MSELQALVEGLKCTIAGECARAAWLIDAQLILVRYIMTAALLDSEGRVSNAICHVCDGPLVDVSSGTLGLSPGGSSDQSQVLFNV